MFLTGGSRLPELKVVHAIPNLFGARSCSSLSGTDPRPTACFTLTTGEKVFRRLVELEEIDTTPKFLSNRVDISSTSD